MSTVKGKKILKYNMEIMEKAVEAVKKGMATKTAAKQFGVPKTTLHYHVVGKYQLYTPIGAKTAFTPDEENLLVKWVLDLASKGFPITKGNFLFSIRQLAKEMNVQFKNGKPSRKWFESFMKRHPNVSLRTAQNLTISKAAVTKQNLHDWFTEVFDYLKVKKSENILKSPEKLFNLDETAFVLNPKENLVLARKGEKNVYSKCGPNEKECLSVLVGGNAAGELCPPMIIFDYKRVPSEVAKSIPKEWGIGLSDSGWNTYDTFYCYIVNVFYPWVKENVGFPIILFVDGHISHLSYQLSVFCANNEIILVALYPNATHILQPIDVAVFRTLKRGWREHVNHWKIKHYKPDMKKHEFAPVLQAALNERITPQILAHGFKKCGLYPWDPSEIDSFFESKKVQTPVIEKQNTSYTLRRSIQCLESYIGPDKMSEFKESLDDDWKGREADKSLFSVWRKMHSDLLSINTSSNLALSNVTTSSFYGNVTKPSLQEVSPGEEPLASRDTNQSACCSTETVLQNMASTSKTPQKQVEDSATFTTLSKKAMLDSPSIPTPFKKSLFFPSENERPTTKRKREKIPSVVSSKLWQEYSERKRTKKEQEEREKNERKKLREEKKKEREELMHHKKQKLNKDVKTISKSAKRHLNFNEDTDASNDASCIDSEDFDMETFPDIERQKYGINDFVIVNYEGEYFPGQITDLRENDDKSAIEYQVTVMTMSGPNGWRWPDTEDKIWYMTNQVIERINPPSTTNSRGVCTVPGIFKYRCQM